LKKIQKAVAAVVAKVTAENPAAKVDLEPQVIGFQDGPLYERIILDPNGDWETYHALISAFRRRRSLAVEVFPMSRRIGIADKREKEEYSRLSAIKMAEIDAWWERYHAATPEVRRLMACGIIP